jgi:hypothetical protein
VKTDIRNAFVHASSIGSVTIGGSLIGGAAANSGRIFAGDIGTVKIAGDTRRGRSR